MGQNRARECANSSLTTWMAQDSASAPSMPTFIINIVATNVARQSKLDVEEVHSIRFQVVLL